MLSGDPLLSGQIDLAVVLIVLLKVVAVFAFLLVATMLMIWFERKVVSDFQNRVGPNTAGPFGILQTLADGIKFFFKEDLIPDRAERRVFILAQLKVGGKAQDHQHDHQVLGQGRVVQRPFGEVKTLFGLLLCHGALTSALPLHWQTLLFS